MSEVEHIAQENAMKHRCRLCSVVVITPDSESGDPSSTLGTASIFPGRPFQGSARLLPDVMLELKHCASKLVRLASQILACSVNF